VLKTKRRPAIVVSSNAYHATRPDIIIGLITSVLGDATCPTDYILQDWVAAGLHKPSAFRAFLSTRPASEIIQEIGCLSSRDWQEVQSRLRMALAVS
jgi:mRNA interferase MazF